MRTLVVVLAVLTLPGCGGDRAEEIDRSSPTTVFGLAMKAVHERDLPALWELLSPDGRVRVEQNLKDWQRRLSDPEAWPDLERRIRAALEENGAELDPVLLERARTGKLADVWTFYLTVDPWPRIPPLENIETTEDEQWVRVLYKNPHGTIVPMLLKKTPRGWFVDRIEL